MAKSKGNGQASDIADAQIERGQKDAAKLQMSSIEQAAKAFYMRTGKRSKLG